MQKLSKLDVQVLNENDDEHCRGKLNTELSVGSHKPAVDTEIASASLLNASGNESERKNDEENVEENEEDNELPVLRTSSRKRIRAHQDD